MSGEDVEIAQRSFVAYNSGGIEALLRLHAPDTVWYSLADWLEDPIYRGHDGARKLSAAFTDCEPPQRPSQRARPRFSQTALCNSHRPKREPAPTRRRRLPFTRLR
jgi:ketosteroid isomerase-like protein